MREGCDVAIAFNFFNFAVFSITDHDQLVGIDVDAALLEFDIA
ncbi:Uncharacterised protein [Vibrio cholerae]|nr:Uncharacterised protein [Vibrio cholerae]